MRLLDNPTATAAGRLPLGVLRACRLQFAAGAAAAPDRDSGELRYYTDLAGRYGLSIDPVLLADPASACYPEMGLQLLAALQPLDVTIDLVVVAHAVPDLDIGRFVGCTVSEAAGGAPTFAVTDLGTATSFTALRLAGEYARGDDVSHVLLLLLDHTVLPYDTDLPAGYAPTADTGVALLLGPAPAGDGLAVRQFPGVTAEEVAALLPQALVDAVGGAHDAVVVCGAGIERVPGGVAGVSAGLDPATRVVTSPDGQPATGVWTSWLDAVVGAPAARVVLTDYDATLGYLSVVAVDVRA